MNAMPERILVPVDFSTREETALSVAVKLAEKCGGSLVLLHVVPLNIVGEDRGIARARLLQESGREARERLCLWMELFRNRCPSEIIIQEGHPARKIVQQARELKAGAIVMDKHPERRWFQWLRRDTALHVLRHAPCPVILCARSSGQEFASLPARIDPPLPFLKFAGL